MLINTGSTLRLLSSTPDLAFVTVVACFPHPRFVVSSPRGFAIVVRSTEPRDR
jgi:hypothetical protein